MATNKEKYIDNASNEELAQIISRLKYSCKYCPAYNECGEVNCDIDNSFIAFCKKGFLNWLSKEAEEDAVEAATSIMSKALMKVDERIAKLEKRINELQFRYRQLSGIIENQDIRIDKWLNNMQKQIDDLGATKMPDTNGKSADEMFEELGYEKDTFDEFGASEVVYINNNKDHIIVRKNGHYVKYNYYDFHPDFDYNNIKFITEAEDKAIHKKIEELKNENNKN